MSAEHSEIEVSQYEPLGELLDSVGGVKRLQAFLLLSDGTPPKEITGELDISRSGLQNYINDFKNLGLVKKDGKSLVPTETGEWFHEALLDLEEEYASYRRSAAVEDYQELLAYASDSDGEFIRQLIREHPEEAREVLEETDSEE